MSYVPRVNNLCHVRCYFLLFECEGHAQSTITASVLVLGFISRPSGKVQSNVQTAHFRVEKLVLPLSNATRLPKEPCFLEGSDASPVCPGKSSMWMKIHLRARAVLTLFENRIVEVFFR